MTSICPPVLVLAPPGVSTTIHDYHLPNEDNQPRCGARVPPEWGPRELCITHLIVCQWCKRGERQRRISPPIAPRKVRVTKPKPEPVSPPYDKKVCIVCGSVKPLDEFNQHSPGKFRNQCKTCRNRKQYERRIRVGG